MWKMCYSIFFCIRKINKNKDEKKKNSCVCKDMECDCYASFLFIIFIYICTFNWFTIIIIIISSTYFKYYCRMVSITDWHFISFEYIKLTHTKKKEMKNQPGGYVIQIIILYPVRKKKKNKTNGEKNWLISSRITYKKKNARQVYWTERSSLISDYK